MDMEDLANKGRVSQFDLSNETAIKVHILEALLHLVISQQTQIIAKLEGRDFEDVAENTQKNIEANIEKAIQQYYDMLARNIK